MKLLDEKLPRSLKNCQRPGVEKCAHETAFLKYRALLERESTYSHWDPNQLYIFKLAKKWFDQAYAEAERKAEGTIPTP